MKLLCRGSNYNFGHFLDGFDETDAAYVTRACCYIIADHDELNNNQ